MRRERVSARQPRLHVLMVTGAYYPELSGGGLQARRVVRALSDRARFTVITTSIRRDLPAVSEEDGVRIFRIYVDPASRRSRFGAAVRLARVFVAIQRDVDVVNLHGFSSKAVLVRVLARFARKPYVLTLQTGRDDEPAAARRLGRAADWAYRSADLVLSVSPSLSRAYLAAGLDPARLRQVCNAVETDRFHPADEASRSAVRRELGLALDTKILLFVGYFSSDKRPDALFAAWRALPAPLRARSTLVFVGATGDGYGEIAPGLSDSIRRAAAADGLADRLRFVESTLEIEKYFRAADLFVLPSRREGLSIALLEAMASGLPCVASRLEGSTDAIIEHGRSGWLVPPDDVGALRDAIATVLTDSDAAARAGRAARAVVEARFSIAATAADWLDAYRSCLAA